jgi:hypothetical protein
MTCHCGHATCVAKERCACASQGTRQELPADSLGLATEGSFGCAGAGSLIPCSLQCWADDFLEELPKCPLPLSPTTTSTALRKAAASLLQNGPWGSGGCETYSLPSSRYRALEAAASPLSRSSTTCSTGTTGVKKTAALLEQVDALASAVGTTRAAVRRPISETTDFLCRDLISGPRNWLAIKWRLRACFRVPCLSGALSKEIKMYTPYNSIINLIIKFNL